MFDYQLSEHPMANEEQNKKRGFAAMDPEEQREIASQGGKAAHEKGTANEFDSESAREAGRKGGEARQRNNEEDYEENE